MTNVLEHPTFKRITDRVGKFNLKGKKLLIPDMAPIGARLFAASFRSFGVDAEVMETCKGLDLGKAFTSGKECYPCQVTLGDVLFHLNREKERLGKDFSPENYVYFLPEADGPCRFGMYNKFQRLVLDRFPQFADVRIAYLSTADAYSTEGILPPEEASLFRKLSYVGMVVVDVLDRITWRVRPYERIPGSTDRLIEEAVRKLEALLSERGRKLPFKEMYEIVEDTAEKAKALIDYRIPRKPKIGIVGEIYLRTHPGSNQNLIRLIERFGGEVVNASLSEWFNFVSYEGLRKLSREIRLAWHLRYHRSLWPFTKRLIAQGLEVGYQTIRQRQVYRRVLDKLDIQPDHSVWRIESHLRKSGLFSFQIGTEAALSIGGAIEYILEGFDGIVNVFPFTCMPSTVCAAILRPILARYRIPYLDVAYDDSIQPNREMAIRTFVYQASQRRFQKAKGA
ncbi:MAG: CoA activase [Syntrophobacterales bacterium]|nr:CoA activase [Syntrophobacterales bacterium]